MFRKKFFLKLFIELNQDNLLKLKKSRGDI